MVVKTFRGLMVNGGQDDKINLHTGDGATGYRIVKFEMAANNPGLQSQESVMQIFKVLQTTITSVVDYSDPTLLGNGFYSDSSSGTQGTGKYITIFDQEIFNQDIYVTHVDANGVAPCNYYIELEQMKLSDNENTVATLKDIKANV